MDKSINQKALEDKKISIAIISSFLVLMLQYFILYYFDIERANVGKTVQIISKIVVGFFFIYSFKIVFIRSGILFILLYSISIVVFSFSYLFFPQNIKFLNDILFKYFFICIPSFIYSFSINDRKVFKDTMDKASSIIFIVGFVTGALVFLGEMSLGTYSMSFSYYMLFPAIIYLNDFLERFSIKSLILAFLSLFVMLTIGSRGAIISSGIYVILHLLINAKDKSPNKVILNIIILMVIIIFSIYLKEILFHINSILLRHGIYSRNISLFLGDGINLSGRDIIYKEVLEQIRLNPILGIGLAGDRVYTGGTYSHNIFLEILSGFGVIVGSFILFVIVIISIKVLFSKDVEGSNLLLIWFCMGFVPLLVSGSYLTDFQFWIYLGLAVRFLKETKVSEEKVGK